MPERTERQTTRNGSSAVHARWTLVAAGGPSLAYDDPMSKVLGLDAKTSSLGAWFGYTSGSTLLLAALMALTSVVAWIHSVHAHAAAAPEEIDVMREEAPPPPPPQAEETKPEPAAPVHHARETPAPAPAKAANVLTQEPDPNEPVDLTDNTIIQGNAEVYAGGVTSANGTSATAVHSMALAPTGPPGGAGASRAALQATGPDRSRLASGENIDWNGCPFPPEADAAQIDEADVMLEVDVRPDGRPSAVRVLKDPGNGFGREARQYAMKQRFLPALDHDGNPVAGSRRIVAHFRR